MTKALSSAAATLKSATEWVVVVLDHPGVLARRIEIRPQHSPNFVKLHREGYVSWAGPLFHTKVASNSMRPFKGSALVLNDTSQANIEARLKSDVYVTHGIWDMDRALIAPFRTLMRREVQDGAADSS